MTRAQEIAWAAGLFEGEGCFCLIWGKKPRVDMSQTDLDVLQRFRAIVGGRILGPYQKAEKNKPIYRWTMYRASEIIVFIRSIRPMLGERRGARADQVTEQAWRIVAGMVIRAAGKQPTLEGFVVPASTMSQLAAALGEEN